MISLYHDAHYTFRFAEDRRIPRFHLDGMSRGQRVSVFKIDPSSGERLQWLTTATVGEEGWVDLAEPIVMRAGEAFVAAPDTDSNRAGHRLRLLLMPDALAICRLPADAALPDSAAAAGFLSITRTADELSLVCPQTGVPPGVRSEPGWRCLRVAGKIPFTMVGVLSSLVAPLAEAGIGVFVISTFDTDYLLLKAEDLGRAITKLQHAGHSISE